MWALGGMSLLVMAVDQPTHPKLHAALNGYQLEQHKKYFATSFTPTSPAEYRVHLQDLNGDGHQDALVLMLGRDYGGTCGRTMFIFRGGKSFRFVSRMTCVQEPICILDTHTKGWHDLAIGVFGGGAKRRYAHMRSTGAQYPLNPTVAPVLAGWPQGTFVLPHGDATVKALIAGRSHFTGVLGKATRFQLGLQHDTGKVQGSYFYEKYGKPIALKGTASGARVQLDEMKGEQVTARLSLKRSTTGWAGEWRSADGGKVYPLRLQQVATERRRDQHGPYDAHVSTAYPVFTGEAGRRFNVAIEKTYLDRYGEVNANYEETFLDLQRDLAKDPDFHGESHKRWRSDESGTVRFYSADLISVRGHIYEYSGGAHGNYADFGVNYWWQNGQPRKLVLADLFDDRKKWRKVVGGYIRRNLTKREASWPPKTDQDAVDAPFTFSPAGVEFHFAPYHVGSYAEGMYHVLVPYTVLKPVLRPGGPLARWAK